MPVILALETATNACSVALARDGDLVTEFCVAPREHAERILGMITQVMAQSGLALANIDAIAFGEGPGSFLGTRIAAGVAQGLGFALDKPLLPVPTLHALAEQAHTELSANRILAAWDARMNAVYWSLYEATGNQLEPVNEVRLSSPSEVHLDNPGGVVLVGHAWTTYRNDFSQAIQKQIETTPEAGLAFYPRAEYLLRQANAMLHCGQTVSADHASPVYLRNPVLG